MHGAIALKKPLIDRELQVRALRLLREEMGGGEIRGVKLYPIAPVLSALRPLEPACALQRRWHVVQTQPQQERTVVDQLKGHQLDAYWPVEAHKVRVNAMRHRKVMRPMLPGYLFAGFDVRADTWEVVPAFKGVIRLLMIELRPVPIPEAVIARIREIETARAGDRTRKPVPVELKAGVLVRVLDPFSFAGLFGFITEVDTGKGQVCVEIDIFKRLVPIWLFPDQVERV